MTVLVVAALWGAGGALLCHGMLTNEEARPETIAGARDIVAALERADPAALVAVGLFLVAWPVIFIGAHVARLSQ